MCSVPGPDGLHTHFDQLREYIGAHHAHETQSHEKDSTRWSHQQLEPRKRRCKCLIKEVIQILSWYTHVCVGVCVCVSSIFLDGEFTDLETVGGSAVTTVMDSLVDHLKLSTCLSCGNHGNWPQH